MKSSFEPDANPRSRPAAELIDPEAYDASEQQFAASLEQSPPRFVVEANDSPGFGAGAEAPATLSPAGDPIAAGGPHAGREPGLAAARTRLTEPEELGGRPSSELRSAGGAVDQVQEAMGVRPQPDPDAWRQELAARLTNYRARRRPREPRYPSLRLKFEASEPLPSPCHPAEPAGPQPGTRAATAVPVARCLPAAQEMASAGGKAYAGPLRADPAETTARIIPFPRVAAAPPRPLEELAGPVLDRLRILEAPEMVPPPPALGGILIEPVEEPPDEKRRGIELPLQPAPMSRRLLAAGIDGLLVASACFLFAYVFFRMTAMIPPLRQATAVTVALAGVLWTAYQYLLLLYSGATPGLKLAKLRLSRFDGGGVPRRLRRWRVLASVLSAASLGLGYAWCMLDQDELCWHDRITGTYLAPRP